MWIKRKGISWVKRFAVAFIHGALTWYNDGTRAAERREGKTRIITRCSADRVYLSGINSMHRDFAVLRMPYYKVSTWCLDRIHRVDIACILHDYTWAIYPRYEPVQSLIARYFKRAASSATSWPLRRDLGDEVSKRS